MQNSNLSNNFTKKLSSYTALAGAFLAFGPNAIGQCGTADASNPVLDVDINGDGIPDVSLEWQSTQSNGPINTTLFGSVGTVTISGTRMVSNYYTYGLMPPQYTSIIGGTFCYVVSVPGATMGGGPNGSLYAVPGIFSTPFYIAGSANGVLNYTYKFYGVSSLYLLTQNTFVRNNAYVNAAGSNQVIGLTNATGNVCDPACLGGANVALGSNLLQYYAGVIYQYANQGVNYNVMGTLTAPNPFASLFSCSIGTGIIPGYPNGVLPISSNFVTTGPVTNLLSGTGTRCLQPNTNTTTFLAIKFKGPDLDGDGQMDTYNGWIEISIDPKTSAVTCVSSGYNSCSIEQVNQMNGTSDTCPADADIEVGAADPGNVCTTPACDADNGVATIKINGK